MIPDSFQPGGAIAAEEDIMRVERSATPDGRLLLYFTFEPAASPHSAESGGVTRGTRPSDQIASGGER